MAKTHYTNFYTNGSQISPLCADKDGYITYNARHFKKILRKLREGWAESEIGVVASPGTWYVVMASWDLEQRRLR